MLCLLGAASAFGQTRVDQRLNAKFDPQQLADLQAKSPEVVAYWSYYLDHSYTISDAPVGKDISMYAEIEFTSIENFNILNTDLNMLRSSEQYYRIAGSDQIFVLLSNDAFVKKFNSTRQL